MYDKLKIGMDKVEVCNIYGLRPGDVGDYHEHTGTVGKYRARNELYFKIFIRKGKLARVELVETPYRDSYTDYSKGRIILQKGMTEQEVHTAPDNLEAKGAK